MLFVSEISGHHLLLPGIIMLKLNLLVVWKVKLNRWCDDVLEINSYTKS